LRRLVRGVQGDASALAGMSPSATELVTTTVAPGTTIWSGNGCQDRRDVHFAHNHGETPGFAQWRSAIVRDFDRDEVGAGSLHLTRRPAKDAVDGSMVAPAGASEPRLKIRASPFGSVATAVNVSRDCSLADWSRNAARVGGLLEVLPSRIARRADELVADCPSGFVRYCPATLQPRLRPRVLTVRCIGSV